ncbi:hypothetical protein MJO28_011263 [Puccinia striiformis f. sp. tritici]|uniref:Uncharacterized protein n=1 Tax=Puccinia striiformis f. sp. tritici TaxID=168172 RepID=A0ACC0E3S9_9BASI|nr:hypothetical protein MJO28_011263 [Puccinia striiformis f. sp. tritici]
MQEQRGMLLELATTNSMGSKIIDQVLDKLIENTYGDLHNVQVLSRKSFINRVGRDFKINKLRIFDKTGGQSYTSQAIGWVSSTLFKYRPASKIDLRLGMPVIVTEHSFMKGGVVRGTRLVVTGIYNGFLKASIISGVLRGDE